METLKIFQNLQGLFLHLVCFARSDAERFPFTFVFQAMLNPITVVQFIETLRLDEHLIAVEQPCEAGLSGLGAFALTERASLRVM